MYSFLRVFTLCITLLFSLPISSSHAASFDCTKAGNDIEKQICSDGYLSALDEALGKNYDHMRASPLDEGMRKELRDSQLAWLRVRNSCQTRDCLINSYMQRIDAICEFPVLTGMHPICIHSSDVQDPTIPASSAPPLQPSKPIKGAKPAVVGKAVHQPQSSPMDLLIGNQWSIDTLPCDLHGGAYKEFGEQFVTGERLTTGGMPSETGQRAWKAFTQNSDDSITLHYKIYADGNPLMTGLTGSSNTIVSEVTRTFRVNGNVLTYDSIIKMIDLDALLANQGVRYETTRESSRSTSCNSL